MVHRFSGDVIDAHRVPTRLNFFFGACICQCPKDVIWHVLWIAIKANLSFTYLYDVAVVVFLILLVIILSLKLTSPISSPLLLYYLDAFVHRYTWFIIFYWCVTKLAFTYSKPTIETLRKRCEICSKLTIKTRR